MKIKRKRYKLLIIIILLIIYSLTLNSNYKIINKNNILKINSNRIYKQDKLIINKIGLNKPLYKKDSKLNNVEYSITYLNESSYPDQDGGTVILAAHSGNSNISYFENINKLKINDEIKLIYNNKLYTYNVVNIYNNEKNGYININKNNNSNRLVLTTCHPTQKDKQFILIATNKKD